MARLRSFPGSRVAAFLTAALFALALTLPNQITAQVRANRARDSSRQGITTPTDSADGEQDCGMFEPRCDLPFVVP